MWSRAALVVVLALSVVLGVLLGPVLLGPDPSASTGPDPTAGSPPAGSPSAEQHTSAVTPPTRTATGAPPPTEEPTLTPEVAADRHAGVIGYDVPAAGPGDLLVVPGTTEAPEGEDPVTTVRVEVETGLEIDPDAFAAFVMATLNDPRGWGADGSVRFSRTDGEADIRVVLATPTTVDAMCAPLATNSRWSCGRYGHAALNAQRWVLGATAFLDGGGTLTEYREYLVNHEVGHLFGHQHVRCPGDGEVAPVMVQQSISVQGCEPNGWPFP